MTHEEVTQEQLGGAKTHVSKSGVANYASNNEMEAIAKLREVFDYLPLSNKEKPPVKPCADPRDRADKVLDMLIPSDPNTPYNMREVVERCVDDEEFCEMSPDFAKNIMTGFARFEGRTVGIVANQPSELAGCLDIDASVKSARFVRFCDAFNIPLVTFVDVPGLYSCMK